MPEIASRGSFCPPEIASLMLARMLCIGWPAARSTLRIEVFGCFATRRGDIPIGAIQRAYSSNTSSHLAFPSRTSLS